MAFSPDYRTYPGASAATTAAVMDAGLRAYMLRVYNWMSSGLLLTGIVAYAHRQHQRCIDAVLSRWCRRRLGLAHVSPRRWR